MNDLRKSFADIESSYNKIFVFAAKENNFELNELVIGLFESIKRFYLEMESKNQWYEDPIKNLPDLENVEVDEDNWVWKFKTPFTCKKCGSNNHTTVNFLVKCNDCGNIEEKLLKL